MGKAKGAKRARAEGRDRTPQTIAVPVEYNRWTVPAICVVLSALTLAVYWQVSHFPFTDFDDPDYIINNPLIRGGITARGIAWGFGVGRAGNWFPLTWMSHMLDVDLFGITPGALAGSGGHHLTSVALHVLNTVLLCVVLNRMTGLVWQSAFVAALFALHPLHVESVAWVAERKDVLSTFFMMLTLLLYDAYVKRPRRVVYALLLAVFGLGLMSKQMLISLPILLLLLDYWPLRRLRSADDMRTLVMEKLPLFLMAVAASVVVVLAQRTAEAIAAQPLSLRVANALVSYVTYLGQMFWPQNLAHYYPLSAQQLPWWLVMVSILLLICITFFALRTARSWPMITVGWFWYLISLLPVIGFVQIGGQAHADRYTYVPLIGIALAVVYAVPELVRRLAGQRQRVVLAGLSGAVIVAMIPVTFQQIGYWRDTEILYRRALAVTTDNWFVHMGLASILFRQADALRVERRLDDAKKVATDAVEHAQVAIRINPTMAEAHNNLAAALSLLARLETRQTAKANLLNDATREYELVLSAEPSNAIANNNLASLYLDQGKFDLAVQHFEAALRTDPNVAAMHYNLALALDRNGQADAAIDHYRKVLELYPNEMNAYWSCVHLARLMELKGQREVAVRLLTQAVQINHTARVDAAHNVAQTRLAALTNP